MIQVNYLNASIDEYQEITETLSDMGNAKVFPSLRMKLGYERECQTC
jgi:hypothetical protein